MFIKVTAEKWAEYLKKKSEKNALEKEIKKLEDSFEIPEAGKLAVKLGIHKNGKPVMVEGKAKTGEIVIVNGNADEVGKLTVFWFPGCEIPASWRKRIS